MTSAAPQFCPWCGTPIGFEDHEHQPRYEALTDQARAEGKRPPPLPARIEELLAGESYIGACPGCRTVSHVVGHRAHRGQSDD
jgi:hypothetical protein